MIDIHVRADLSHISRRLTTIQQREIPRVAVTSMNRAGLRMVSEAGKAIGEAIGIKPKEARGGITQDKASVNRLFTRVRPNASGRRATNLIAAVTPSKRHPGAFSKGKGVTARLYKKTSTYAHTFIIPAAGSGKAIVVQRRGAKRLPVVAKSLPSISTVLHRDEIRAAVIAKGRAVWDSEFSRNLQRAIDRLRKN